MKTQAAYFARTSGTRKFNHATLIANNLEHTNSTPQFNRY